MEFVLEVRVETVPWEFSSLEGDANQHVDLLMACLGTGILSHSISIHEFNPLPAVEATSHRVPRTPMYSSASHPGSRSIDLRKSHAVPLRYT